VPSIERLIRDPKHQYVLLAVLNVGYCRRLGLEVAHTPIEDNPDTPGNPEHISILMPKPGRHGRAERLREHAIKVPINAAAASMHRLIREQIAALAD
jgi:hypothetical protein